MTGLDCPGCGGQRAAHQLLHGNFAVAFRSNALFVSLLPLAVICLTRLLWAKLTGDAVRWPFRRVGWVWLLAGLVVAFGIVRNLPGFEWLRP